MPSGAERQALSSIAARGAAARLPRTQVPTAPASLQTSVWGKGRGFCRKRVTTTHADTVLVSCHLQSATNSTKATCNGRLMSASTFSISLWHVTTASPEPNLISLINSKCLRRELAGKGFVRRFPWGEKGNLCYDFNTDISNKQTLFFHPPLLEML